MPKKTVSKPTPEQGKALNSADRSHRIELWYPGITTAAYLVIRKYQRPKPAEVTKISLTMRDLDALIDMLVDSFAAMDSQSDETGEVSQ